MTISNRSMFPVFIFLLLAFSGLNPAYSENSQKSPRTIRFSGYNWLVKSKKQPAGPGPNYFGGGEKNVFLDESGRLHLKVTGDNDRYYCAEIIRDESMGYGKYIFHIDSDIRDIDDSAVLGLFTYSHSPEYSHREIDIEFSKWGREDNENSQFAVQPSEKKGNKLRFDLKQKYDSLIVQFHWKEDSVDFECYGTKEKKKELLKSWIYKGDNVPKKGDETCRMNLWLFRGKEPAKESEVIIRKFEFVPEERINDKDHKEE